MEKIITKNLFKYVHYASKSTIKSFINKIKILNFITKRLTHILYKSLIGKSKTKYLSKAWTQHSGPRRAFLMFFLLVWIRQKTLPHSQGLICTS